MPRRVRLALAGLALAAFGAWLLGCGDEDLTGVGRDLRAQPDTLYVATLRTVFTDTVFAIPGSMGRAPVAQIGQQLSYTSHALYAFRIPSRVVDMVDGVADTLRVDELHLSLKTDSMTVAPFTGTMRMRILEIAPGAPRGWTRASFIDSALVDVPITQPDPLAPDTLVSGAALANDVGELDFNLVTARIADFDSARARGDSIDVNVVIQFESFTTPGKGFLELPLRDTAGRLRGNLIAFSNDRETAIVTAIPFRSRPVVEYQPNTCPTGGHIAVSDGFRLHTYLRFAPIRRVVPDSAIVFLAEVVVVQTDTTTGCASFGTGDQTILGIDLGIVVPADTNAIFSDTTAARPIAFRAPVAPVPSTTTSIVVTPYVFDIHERNVTDRGFILRLSAEGTRARHFEFHGPTAADSLLRPALRIVYGFPAGFEGGRR